MEVWKKVISFTHYNSTKNIGHIFQLPIKNVKEYNEHKIYFEVYDSSIWNHRSYVMEKNRHWGVYSPSIEGLQMYWKREVKRIFRKYNNTNNEWVKW